MTRNSTTSMFLIFTCKLWLATFGSASGSSFSWRLNEHASVFPPQTFLEVFWIHVGTASDQQRVPGGSFTTASIKASFLGVHPSESQKYTAKTKHPRTFTLAWATIPSFSGMYVTAPSSLPTTAPRVLSIFRRLFPTWACDPHCFAFSSGIPAVSFVF